MDRELIVTLLRKQILELEMMTQGFMEMKEYPASIVELARVKTSDIHEYIDKLAALKASTQLDSPKVEVYAESSLPKSEPVKNLVETRSFQSIPNDEIGVESIHEEDFTQQVEPDTKSDEEILEVSVPAVEIHVDPIETPAVEESEVPPVVSETEIVESTQAEEKSNSVLKENKKHILAEKIMPPTTSRNEQLSKVDNSLSSSIANKKVDDIKQAISIGDRFRFQRELFKGNGEEMNKTMLYINQIATYEEAVSFLQSKYGWKENDENATDFYQIVRRRFA